MATVWNVPSSIRNILPKLASQMRVAFSNMVPNTGSSSPGDELMTRSTSAVAVCCSSDCRNSLSSRVFSMAMTAWAAGLNQFDLLVGKGEDFLAVDHDGTDQFPILQHRDPDYGTRPTILGGRSRTRLLSLVVGACDHFRSEHTIENASRVLWLERTAPHLEFDKLWR